MSYTPNGSKISTVNSSTSLLGPGSSFTGAWEDITNFVSISVNCYADVPGTLYAQFSDDATENLPNFRNVQLSSGESGSMGLHTLVKISRYFRIKVTNGISTQTDFAVTSIYSTNPLLSLPTSRLSQDLGDYSPVINTRGALFGSTEGGDYWQPISAEAEGHLEVSISAPRTAFGEVSVSSMTPKAQVDFVYGINSNLGVTTTTGIGSVFASNGVLICSAGAATTSSGVYTTRRYVKYKPGQGVAARFTAFFTTGVSSNNQIAGVGDENNGFFFGCIGTQYGIVYRNNGTQTLIPQASWNNDNMSGNGGADNKSGVNLDYTKGNVYQIKFQYLGFGNAYFYIENPLQGQFALVHTLRYPNANTTPLVRNPSFPFRLESINFSNNTDVRCSSASVGLFIEGPDAYLGPRYASNNNKSSITTETNIISIKNCTSLNGISNRSNVVLRTISYSSSASNPNGVITLRVIRNTTLGGSPSWIPIDGVTADSGNTITSANSGISTDVAGTTVSGGQTLYNSVSYVSGNVTQDVTDLNIFINPGETLTVAIQSTQSASVAAAITWSEDI